MNIQPGESRNLNRETAGNETLNLEPWPAPLFFDEKEYPEGLEDNALNINLNPGPSESQSPEIDPEEFESIYLWFLS